MPPQNLVPSNPSRTHACGLHCVRHPGPLNQPFTLDSFLHAQAVSSVSSTALHTLKHSMVVPQATFHVLKAALHMLGKDPESFKNWKLCYQHLHTDFFHEFTAFDATADRNLEVRGRRRRGGAGQVGLGWPAPGRGQLGTRPPLTQ